MTTIQLNNKTMIPQLGLGVWKATPDETLSAVKTAFEVGYSHIDTAWIYGNEQAVGQALAQSGKPRADIYITTKLWRDHHDDPEAAFAESLRNLGLDYVDLYLSHFPAAGTRIDAYRKMEKILASGQAKAIGVSNYTIRHLDELLRETSIVPAINQVEIHTFLRQSELVEYCQNQGIVVEAYSPLAHGQRLSDPGLQAIAAKHQRTPAQVMIRWCIEKNFVVIPKSVTPTRIAENFAVFDFALDEEDLRAIEGFENNLRTCWDPTDAP